jgi:hypothetical protein
MAMILLPERTDVLSFIIAYDSLDYREANVRAMIFSSRNYFVASSRYFLRAKSHRLPFRAISMEDEVTVIYRENQPIKEPIVDRICLLTADSIYLSYFFR